jgi:hypothetical protein
MKQSVWQRERGGRFMEKSIIDAGIKQIRTAPIKKLPRGESFILIARKKRPLDIGRSIPRGLKYLVELTQKIEERGKRVLPDFIPHLISTKFSAHSMADAHIVESRSEIISISTTFSRYRKAAAIGQKICNLHVRHAISQKATQIQFHMRSGSVVSYSQGVTLNC